MQDNALTLPGRGSAYEPLAHDVGDAFIISFKYETDKKDGGSAEIYFRRPSAYRWIRSVLVPGEQDYEGAFNAVLEVDPSEWADQARELERVRGYVRRDAAIRHFSVYFDDEGLYEVLADSFEIREGRVSTESEST